MIESSPPVSINDVSEAKLCIRCAYSLVGLPLEGKCPECGLPIAITVRMALANAPDAYLRSIASGIRWIRLSAIIGSVLLVLVIVNLGIFPVVIVLIQTLATAVNISPGLATTVLFFALVVTLIGLAFGSLRGALAFTVRDRDEVETAASTGDRITIRGIAMYQCAANICCLCMFVFGVPSFTFAAVVGGAMIVAAVLQVVQVSATTRRAGWLLSRSSNRRGYERARSHATLVPILMLFGMVLIIFPLIAMVIHFDLLSRLRSVVLGTLDERQRRERTALSAACEPG